MTDMTNIKKYVPYKPHPDDFTKIYITDELSVPRHVVCAANKFIHNDEEIVVCGARHWDNVMHKVVDAIGIDDTKHNEQGFIDQYGLFITRTEATEIVLKNEQKLLDDNLILGDLCFSENLY